MYIRSSSGAKTHLAYPFNYLSYDQIDRGMCWIVVQLERPEQSQAKAASELDL